MGTLMSSHTLTRDEVRWTAAQFGRAPSIHNTQPWRLEWTGTFLRILGDPDRQLRVADPQRRELLISCGAALFGLRLALRRLGVEVDVRRLPEPLDADLMAEVRIVDRRDFLPGPRMMPPGFERRHTPRGTATPVNVPVALAAAMQQSAVAEGAELLFVNDPGPLAAVLRLSHDVERAVADDAFVLEETERWTFGRDERRRDGVPGTAFPSGSFSGGPRQLARRDFDLRRGIGRLDGGTLSARQVAALTTVGDRPVDWLHAGEALHALLIVAAEQWVFAEFNSRVAEHPGARAQLRRELGTPSYPHLLLQFCAGHIAPHTPRREVDEFLSFTGSV